MGRRYQKWPLWKSVQCPKGLVDTLYRMSEIRKLQKFQNHFDEIFTFVQQCKPFNSPRIRVWPQKEAASYKASISKSSQENQGCRLRYYNYPFRDAREIWLVDIWISVYSQVTLAFIWWPTWCTCWQYPTCCPISARARGLWVGEFRVLPVKCRADILEASYHSNKSGPIWYTNPNEDRPYIPR